MVTVIGLRSGAQRLVIDTGMEVYGLKVSDNAIAVEGGRKLVVWNLPEKDGPSDGTAAAATIEDSIWTTTPKALGNRGPKFTSISPDFLIIAETWPGYETGAIGSLAMHDVNTGARIGKAKANCDMPWFSPDGNQIWCEGDIGMEQGWEIVRTSGSPKIKLVPLAVSPPEDWPWRSSRGYTIADDGWILSREGKQLMWLPPRWRSDERGTRVWSGRFLALLHGTLSDPVVLELLE
jgi:hypothetical protein